MINYKKVFLKFWDFTIADYIPCAYCSSPSVDIHHLVFKSQGGKDEPNNLIALCRYCHEKAHKDKNFNLYLKELHEINIKHKLSNAKRIH